MEGNQTSLIDSSDSDIKKLMTSAVPKSTKKSPKYAVNVFIPEFLKTGLVKIRAHFTTWQLKAIKSVQRPIKKPISDAEQ